MGEQPVDVEGLSIFNDMLSRPFFGIWFCRLDSHVCFKVACENTNILEVPKVIKSIS